VETGLRDKVVLVTGGAGGIGVVAAQRFVEEGARVVLADLDAAALEAADTVLASAAASSGASRVRSLLLDITDVGAVEHVIATTVRDAGQLDVLVNTAGVWTEGPSDAVREADWDRCLEVNLKGLFFCCSRAIPHLRATRGCIVNIASDAGLVGTPETAAYSASKGGVVLITKVLAIELAPHGVRVNAVCPADVMTSMLEGQARASGDPDAYYRMLLSCYPQGEAARFIQPQEVADLVVYLASTAAASITGAAVSIDNGTTAGYGYS
jgi:NAD(P)-dependent dehydrogenase (short-subunit alcohol dehydrogenase family)